jgi:hypothetical protein
MKSKLVAIQSPKAVVVLRRHSKTERKQGDSVPCIQLKLVPSCPSSIRCLQVRSSYSNLKGIMRFANSQPWPRWALSGESKTGKETSLEDNEKEPEPSWDSRGGDVL